MTKIKFSKKICELVLMLVIFSFYGCIGGGGSGTDDVADSSKFNIKISMQNPNNVKVYGVYLKLDYGGVKVTGSKKALAVSNNPRGGTSWDKVERKSKLVTGADDKLWWHNSGDGLLHLKGEGRAGMNRVSYNVDGKGWVNVEGNVNTKFTAPASGENFFSIDFKLMNLGLALGRHDVKVKFSSNDGAKETETEIPAEIFTMLDSEGVEITPSGIAPPDSIVIANDSYIGSGDNNKDNSIFMKIGLIHHEGLSGSGDILVIPVKIIGDKSKISIKDPLASDKDGNPVAGITLGIDIEH